MMTTLQQFPYERTWVVRRDGASLGLEMPALRPWPIQPPSALSHALGRRPKAVLAAKHYLCLFDHVLIQIDSIDFTIFQNI